jgi:hypothetical protein
MGAETVDQNNSRGEIALNVREMSQRDLFTSDLGQISLKFFKWQRRLHL